MATFPYTIGESGTLGFPVFQYDGTPLPTDGLAVRLVVYLTGADLILPGTWESGTIDVGSGIYGRLWRAIFEDLTISGARPMSETVALDHSLNRARIAALAAVAP